MSTPPTALKPLLLTWVAMVLLIGIIGTALVAGAAVGAVRGRSRGTPLSAEPGVSHAHGGIWPISSTASAFSLQAACC